MTDTCSTCRWFAPNPPKPETGNCRRNAPVSYVYSDGTPSPRWARVHSLDFCGKHEAKREVTA